MRIIRSLLWIGSGQGLQQSGLTEAPELDITWVPNIDEAECLPQVQFDGVLLEACLDAQPRKPGSVCEDDESDGRSEPPHTGTPSLLPEDERTALIAIERFARREAVLVTLPITQEPRAEAYLAAGVGVVLLVDDEKQGLGFVTEVNEALDRLHDGTQLPSKEEIESEPPTDCHDPVPQDQPHAEPDTRVVSSSRAMKEVSKLVDLAASSPSTVLVTGETGAGKEVVARELHARSPRAEAPFVAINCAAFPETLLESELFGHARGAFTGADRAKQGLFEAAGTGTLFLDEIAEMGLALQAKLLRVLQEREVRPVGETRSRPVLCRIVAATNRLLAHEVESGSFREDLFYRLNVFPIRLPPLRERRRDIVPLAHYFLARHGPREAKFGCHLSLATRHLLEGYHWPGNVRELENEILRALMLAKSGDLITPKLLSPKLVEILEPVAHGARPEETLREALERVEAWMIRRALSHNDGRKTQTAKKLGLTREGLYKKIKRLGLE